MNHVAVNVHIVNSTYLLQFVITNLKTRNGFPPLIYIDHYSLSAN